MKHYYMFNKPFGCVTAHRDDRFPVVMDYFHSLENDRLSPVGRLDRETEGLLMITDDGIWNQEDDESCLSTYQRPMNLPPSAL